MGRPILRVIMVILILAIFIINLIHHHKEIRRIRIKATYLGKLLVCSKTRTRKAVLLLTLTTRFIYKSTNLRTPVATGQGSMEGLFRKFKTTEI